MHEPKLPVVSAETSPHDALNRIFDADVSGVLMLEGENARLLHARDIADSLKAEFPRVGDIDRFEAVSVQVTGPDGVRMLVGRSNASGVAMLGADAIAATRIVANGQFDRYFHNVEFSRCQNPREPHFYPPRDRDPKNPDLCYCGYLIV
ncbi:hypothetical protein SBC1_61040 (plasmid) [Caballeronia sp. SBC1]|uniref:hypothetical protein n=1 Tax=unclassified Caballeronia TaxID=2646786 RepID=UPI0013E1BCD0|nr:MULTISPECIES: hypothetical protein [unclassified Caballeronia]QIE27992.1 hypothetical protein SBC2_60670 [Caballeronia sp. SBC2]QIN66058.1 hypothetical protein SBC1_61040 [Caballeronia sp. SBC1]